MKMHYDELARLVKARMKALGLPPEESAVHDLLGRHAAQDDRDTLRDVDNELGVMQRAAQAERTKP